MLNQIETNGFILIDKPEGITSYDVIRKIKKILRELGIKTKIGHAGTLDPFATGLLVIMLGKYTRLSDYIMDGFKTYSGTIDIGNRTDTGDYTGEIIESKDIDGDTIDKMIAESTNFVGDFMQIPPQYSALKHNGKPLYEYARKGEFVEKPPREITVRGFNVFKEEAQIKFVTTVSKGTYVRTLIEDYCAKFGILANLKSLRRESSGGITVEDAIDIDDLNVNNFYDKIILLDNMEHDFEAISVDDEGKEKLYNGIRIPTELSDKNPILLQNGEKTFALGKIEDNLIKTICFLGER